MPNQIQATGNTPAPQKTPHPYQYAIETLGDGIDTLENIHGYLGDIVEYCREVSNPDKERQYKRVAKDTQKALQLAYDLIGFFYDYDKSEPFTQTEINDLVKGILQLSETLNAWGYFTLDDIADDSDLGEANHDWLLVDSGYCTNLSEELYDLSETLKGGK